MSKGLVLSRRLHGVINMLCISTVHGCLDRTSRLQCRLQGLVWAIMTRKCQDQAITCRLGDGLSTGSVLTICFPIRYFPCTAFIARAFSPCRGPTLERG
eukprot:6797393-Pyramimonas_sp.AAC.1